MCPQVPGRVKDSPDLPVLGNYQLASEPSKLGLKAREIWFQRYREVLAPALPDARTAIVFLLNEGKPKSPFRTWMARLPENATVSLPTCPVGDVRCDVVAHLNFTHHDLPFRLPGLSLLLFTNSEESLTAEAWHWTWLDRSDRVRLEEILSVTDRCLSGPAVRVTEYDSDAVDEQLLDLSAPGAERYQNSWEKGYFMFASGATKVGGGVFYIQGDPGVFDSEGNRMVFIGQVASTEFCEMGDSGIAYIHYSPVTQEIQIVVSYF